MAGLTVRKLREDELSLWNDLVDRSKQGCLFQKTIWLDAVGSDYYILGCFDKSQRLLGGIPLVKHNNNIELPNLTQVIGIIYDDFSGMKYVKRITKEKDIILSLVESIPKFKYFEYGFHYNFTNWMPFLWNGYSQYDRYTYVLEGIKDIDKLNLGLSDNTKSIINKSLKSNLKVVNNLSLSIMYETIKKTFDRQNMKMPFEYEWFENFDKKNQENNCREMFFAVDEDNNIHAALYLVFDKNGAYYLLGGGDPNFRNSGAMYLNIYEAIKYSAQFTDIFDFEGSIVPQIEHMFRSFGATQKTYFQISKNNSIMLNLKQDIRKYGKLILKR